MILEEVYNLGLAQGLPVDFVAKWHDPHYPTREHDGEVEGFPDPEAALRYAHDAAEEHGFSGILYRVEALIGDIRVLEVAGYDGVT